MTNKTPIRIQTTPRFKHILKNLRKKYTHVVDDLKPFLAALAEGQTLGDQIPDVGYSVYKARLPNRDAQRGKSGGYRIIYYLKTRERVILIDMYAKTEQVNIRAEEIRHLIEEIPDDDLLD